MGKNIAQIREMSKIHPEISEAPIDREMGLYMTNAYNRKIMRSLIELTASLGL